MAIDRKGRGRLSSLDLLPEEAQDDLMWAMAQLNERKRSQSDILFELNDRLEVKGVEPISRSAFNRKSTSLAARAMQLEERRFVYAGVAEKMTPDEVAKNDLVLGEFLKLLIDQIMQRDDIDTRGIMEMAKAYKEIIVGQRHSSEHQKKAEERAKAKLDKAVDAAAGVVGRDGKTDGLAVIRKIREEIYGIFE